LKESLYNLHQQIEEKHWWFAARRQIIHKILSRIAPPEEGLSLINIGCGTGGDLLYLSNSYRCIGLDSSSTAVVAAQKCAPKATVILGSNVEAVPQRKANEQRVWLFLDVLEHIQEARTFFSSYAEVMEPGETVVITVPANPTLWSSHDESFGHYRRYTDKTLKMIWDKLPFKIVLLSHFNTRLYPLIWIIRNIEYKLGKTAGQEGSDFQLLPSLMNTILHKIFYREHKRILGIMDGGSPYHYGVSLIAVLTRIGIPNAGKKEKLRSFHVT
jgi:ubiquinone/menaquinone biosynthesis C-methylase UbiE